MQILETGSHLAGKYQVVKSLGEKPYGHLYLVTDSVAQRKWVMRQITVSLDDETRSSFLGHFYAEGERQSSLIYVQLPRVQEFFLERGYAWTVREYLEGLTLEEWFEKNPDPLPEEAVRKFVLAVARALRVLHTQEPPLYLGGFGPEDVLICDGKMRLVDFGLFRIFPSEMYEGLDDSFLPAWLAPELRATPATSLENDIWALGALAYYLFTRSDPTAVDRLPLREVRPDVSEDIARVIDVCFRGTPERFNSVEELGESLVARPAARRDSPPQPAPGVPAQAAAPAVDEAAKASPTEDKVPEATATLTEGGTAAASDAPPATAVSDAPPAAPDATSSAAGVAAPAAAPGVTPARRRSVKTPKLDVEPEDLTFTAQRGSVPVERIHIYNLGGGNLSGELVVSDTWLQVSPHRFNGNDEEVQVWVDPAQLPEDGTLEGSVTVHTPHEDKCVPVKLVIQPTPLSRVPMLVVVLLLLALGAVPSGILTGFMLSAVYTLADAYRVDPGISLRSQPELQGAFFTLRTMAPVSLLIALLVPVAVVATYRLLPLSRMRKLQAVKGMAVLMPTLFWLVIRRGVDSAFDQAIPPAMAGLPPASTTLPFLATNLLAAFVILVPQSAWPRPLVTNTGLRIVVSVLLLLAWLRFFYWSIF